MGLRSHRLGRLVAVLVLAAVGAAQAGAAPTDADLRIQVFASAETLYVGGKLVYNIAVLNRGPAAAAPVTITATLGASAALRSATLEGGTCSTAPPVTCTFPALGRNQTARARVTVKPRAPGELLSTFAAQSPAIDPDLSNNQGSATVTAKPGHAGPPNVRVRGRLRMPPFQKTFTVEGRLEVDEPGRVTVRVVDARTNVGLPLNPGTRVGGRVLSGRRGSIALDLSRGQVLRLVLRVPVARAIPGRRLAFLARAVDLEGERRDLRVPFVVPPPA